MRRSLYLTGLALLTILFASEANAQRWRSYKAEVYFGMGASLYHGDLGGSSVEDGAAGPLFSDFHFDGTRPAFMFAYKYRFADRYAVRTNLSMNFIAGHDAYAGNEGRFNRNLNFKGFVSELSVQGEYYFLKENIGSRYGSRGVGGSGLDQLAGYLFAGVGVGFFSSKGEIMDANGEMTGEWVKLRELNTEGQGLPGGPSSYSPITAVIPLGIGLKYSLNPQLTIGAEYGFRFTTTDYLDDASGPNYYNNDLILENYGETAALMADKRTGNARFSSNGTRGNNEINDHYQAAFIYMSYRIRTIYRGRSRF